MKSILIAAALGAAFLGTVVHQSHAAPSHCVGLEHDKCTATERCRWQAELTTKNGVTRKAHCRLGSSQPAKTEAASNN
jgi:hypothetical protein